MLTSAELMAQAAITANEYMLLAIDSIDTRFGESYAKKHPDLVGAFMKTAAHDFHACLIKQAFDTLAACQDGQASALEDVAEALGAIGEGIEAIVDKLG